MMITTALQMPRMPMTTTTALRTPKKMRVPKMTPTKAMPRVEERKRALAAKVTMLPMTARTMAAGTIRARSSGRLCCPAAAMPSVSSASFRKFFHLTKLQA
jgi:hypothetical protein